MKKYIAYILGAAAAVFAASCDQISVNETVPHAPVIVSFSPSSAPVGAEVEVRGEYLNDVTSATIGGVPVQIASKVSDTRLSIRVGQDVTSGRIVLTNVTGSGESETVFTRTYAVPEITAALLQEEAELGDEILIAGRYLNSALSVLFVADGYTVEHPASIVSRNDSEMVVKVPYVENSDARVLLTYNDGTAEVRTDVSTAPAIRVIRHVPVFDEYAFERTAVGRSVTLSGQYLNNIDKVTVGDYEAVIYKDSGSLTFIVPAGEFEDGETSVDLKAWYFDENESIVIKDGFIVYVPFVKFWEDQKVWAQGRTEENEYTSFFSPETGIVYANDKWKTVLDPIAMKYNNSQWSGTGNTPTPGVVTDEDYYSVVPYFFISAVSGNVLQINSPANSNSQLKNFFISATGTPANDYRVPGSNNNMPGTPILAFRYLNPSSGSEAETGLYNKVIAGEIENINEALFPIDVAGNTIAGISVASMSGGIKSSSWCDHQTASLVNDPGYTLDAVFLVGYYLNNSYNKDNAAAGIKRLGLLHIKSIDWGVYNNSNFGSSKITFDFYWQKYDYDYSKL